MAHQAMFSYAYQGQPTPLNHNPNAFAHSLTPRSVLRTLSMQHSALKQLRLSDDITDDNIMDLCNTNPHFSRNLWNLRQIMTAQPVSVPASTGSIRHNHGTFGT